MTDPVAALHRLTGTPRLTLALGAANVAVYLAMVIAGVSPFDPGGADLLAWGALFGPFTVGDQWFRLGSAMFLHVGIVHLGLNMLGLLSLGSVLEPRLGWARFLAVYLLCGLSGSIASLLVDPERISAGASGAIFGLAGLLLVAHFRAPASERTSTWHIDAKELGGFVFGNLIYGFVHPSIDNAAHVGGLLTGAVMGLLLASRAARWSVPAGAAAAGVGLLLLWHRGPTATAEERAQLHRELVEYRENEGRIAELEKVAQAHPDSAGAHLTLAEAFAMKGEPEKALRVLEAGLTRSPRDARLLTAVGSLHFTQRRLTDAVRAYERVYALDSTSAEARYNLSVAVNAVGLQARETGDHSTAEASFQRVVALQADSELVAAARGSLASGEAR